MPCVCVLQWGLSGDGCGIASTCVSIIFVRVIYFSELGKGATNEAGKYLFRTANVWWRYAQYFVIASCG